MAWLQVAEAVGPDHQLGGHVAGVALPPPKIAESGAPLDDTAANNVVPLSTQHVQVSRDQQSLITLLQGLLCPGSDASGGWVVFAST